MNYTIFQKILTDDFKHAVHEVNIFYNYSTGTTNLNNPHILESNTRKIGTLKCKENDQLLRISDVKDVNKRKNCLTPVKLESKKQDKKVLASREGLGWEVSNEGRGRATSHLLYSIFIISI